MLVRLQVQLIKGKVTLYVRVRMKDPDAREVSFLKGIDMLILTLFWLVVLLDALLIRLEGRADILKFMLQVLNPLLLSALAMIFYTLSAFRDSDWFLVKDCLMVLSRVGMVVSDRLMVLFFVMSGLFLLLVLDVFRDFSRI